MIKVQRLKLWEIVLEYYHAHGGVLLKETLLDLYQRKWYLVLHLVNQCSPRLTFGEN